MGQARKAAEEAEQERRRQEAPGRSKKRRKREETTPPFPFLLLLVSSFLVPRFSLWPGGPDPSRRSPSRRPGSYSPRHGETRATQVSLLFCGQKRFGVRCCVELGVVSEA